MGGVSEGLLAEDVLACRHGSQGDGCVPVVGGGDDDRIDRIIGEEITVVGVGGAALPRSTFRLFGVEFLGARFGG